MSAGEICCGNSKGAMKLIIASEASIRLEMSAGGFEIASDDVPISPYHLLAGSLASCTALTVGSWAQGAQISLEGLEIKVAWTMIDEHPKRIDRIEVELRWPGLPEGRIAAAERVADQCPIHATLARAAEVRRRIVAGVPGGRE